MNENETRLWLIARKLFGALQAVAHASATKAHGKGGGQFLCALCHGMSEQPYHPHDTCIVRLAMVSAQREPLLHDEDCTNRLRGEQCSCKPWSPESP